MLPATKDSKDSHCIKHGLSIAVNPGCAYRVMDGRNLR